MLKFHPVAEIFPLMQGEAFDALVADVQAHGLREPIWLHQDGRIIDGRNRYRACLAAGVEPAFREYEGQEEWLIKFVLSANLERRHLTSDQRAACAVEALEYEQGLAKARQRQGGKEKVPQKIGEAKKHAGEAVQRAAKQFGTNRTYVGDLAKLKAENPVEYEAVKSGERRLTDIKAARRRGEIRAQQEAIERGELKLPAGVFEVIVVDPPWPYGNAENYNAEGFRGTVPYPEKSLAELAILDLPAANDCIVWLWTTHRFMPDAFRLLDAWGFQHKSIVTWVKNRFGTGRWLRSQTEFCIMAVSGKPKVNLTNQTTVLYGLAREHSRKPDEFYEMVKSLCVGRRLDYFSREARPGWEQFGNEPRKFAG